MGARRHPPEFDFDTGAEWLRVIGRTFSEGMQREDRDWNDEFLLEQRRDWLLRLALDPDNPEDWQRDAKELGEIERALDSTRWTGFPDSDRAAINNARADFELRQILSENAGENYFEQ